ncbi:ECF transporter S component [Clostridium sp.]|uniref:ECF transporter S component n=1 Tax=Clostridium sp. TaxID=1506 RepID=UPI003D6CA320
MENRVSKTKTIDIVQIGIMAGIIYIATYLIKIPVGNSAVFHIGDSMVYLAAILLGKKKGFIAAALGMTIFDLTTPYFFWAPFTLIVKGGMAYITAMIAYRKGYSGDNFWNNLFAFVVAGVWMVLGYLMSGLLVYKLISNNALLAFADIPANIGQVIVGVALALPLSIALAKNNKKHEFIK